MRNSQKVRALESFVCKITLQLTFENFYLHVLHLLVLVLMRVLVLML